MARSTSLITVSGRVYTTATVVFVSGVAMFVLSWPWLAVAVILTDGPNLLTRLIQLHGYIMEEEKKVVDFFLKILKK